MADVVDDFCMIIISEEIRIEVITVVFPWSIKITFVFKS